MPGASPEAEESTAGTAGTVGTTGTTGTDEAAKPGGGDAAKSGPEAKPGGETGSKPGTTSGGSSSEDMPPGEACALAPKHLQIAIKGIQSEFVAGADWSGSSITVTNTSDKAMERVRPASYISSAEIVDRH
ncbi:hypothetical protein [Streptomyces noursei]|uniref:hypothetical protein n=1 Tax=Streptomyces noursei TaxID=1971 RepID=UPI001676ED58|nr:hypothetical protein [Streptomyces noursei]MCZ1013128.1 hypothetical protein [Streptomyces noursei]GGX27186.1 hypothetical protein GCM10010341_55770 [Streptomyces noursei]